MKKTISVLTLALIALSLSFSSCHNVKKDANCGDEKCDVVKPDSLLRLWINAWNTKNSEALKNMIADKAVMLEKDLKIEGRDSIMTKWVSKSMPAISNLNCDRIASCTCCCCISATGFYKLDVTVPQGKSKETGNFTFIWKKQDDKSWKLELMHLTVFDAVK